MKPKDEGPHSGRCLWYAVELRAERLAVAFPFEVCE